MFFHEFSDSEVEEHTSQAITRSASVRGAKAYLSSGIRLESKCGISEVWYWYLEKTPTSSRDPEAPLPRQPKSIFPPLCIDSRCLKTISDTFHWEHLREWPDHSTSDSPEHSTDPSDDRLDKSMEIIASSPLTFAQEEEAGEDDGSTVDSEWSERGHVRVGSDDIEFEEWSPSFQVALSESMREVEKLIQGPTVALNILPPPLMLESESEEAEDQDGMEGVEPSQPRQVRVRTCERGVLSWENGGAMFP